MNRQATLPNRAMGAFPGQPQPQPARGIPPAGARVQAARTGAAPGWGFGMQSGGAPGLPNPQTRNVGSASFAQTIGGAQSASLDPSEFPSLSGGIGAGGQPQYQTANQAVWANQRASQQTPVQRPPPSHIGAAAANQPPSQPHSQDQVQQPLDDAFFPQAAQVGGMDEFRHGGQTGVGQLSSSNQPQPGSIEEFPPLGRFGQSDMPPDRRVNIMQNAASGGYANASGFATGSQGDYLAPRAIDVPC